MLNNVRVVLVHDWLTGMRGGEKCLEVACRRWPRADLFTLLHRAGSVSRVIEDRPIHASGLNRLPWVDKYYRYLLPWMPRAAERWTMPECDLVLSFSHCVAKSAQPPDGVPHACYCFTPMRYAWHMRDAYFSHERGLKARIKHSILERIREWDRSTASRVTHFAAISKTVQSRIAECYGRTSEVIYPPVDTDFYQMGRQGRDDFYLLVSAFAPYKRHDLAIEACKRLDRPLVIIGSGQDEKRLKSIAGSATRFLGWQSNEVIRDHMQRCRALIFPGEEDFGIVPLEAHACGAPVICLGRGGATETVIDIAGSDEPTGVWFEDQTVEGLCSAIERFESCQGDFSPSAARRQAVRFNPQRFANEFFAFIENVVRPAKPIRRAA